MLEDIVEVLVARGLANTGPPPARHEAKHDERQAGSRALAQYALKVRHRGGGSCGSSDSGGSGGSAGSWWVVVAAFRLVL